MDQTIAVFGSSRREADSAFYREAYELGGVLARAGYAVLTGGYEGSMEAASRGAREAGGRVIGVTCAIFDPRPANPWLTEEIKAATLLDRLAVMIARADGFLSFGDDGALKVRRGETAWSEVHRIVGGGE